MNHPTITKVDGDLRYNQMLEAAEKHRQAKRFQAAGTRQESLLTRIVRRLTAGAQRSRKRGAGTAVPA